MASIAIDKKNGHRRILFVALDGRRPTIRLGKVSQQHAKGVKFRVEQILSAMRSGQPIDADTANWIGSLDDGLAAKLARVGLIAPRERQAPTKLGAFLSAYVEGRTDVKPATKLVWGHVQRDLIGFFGKDRDVRQITPGDADDFKRSLTIRLAPATVRKRLQFARMYFRAMLRKRLIETNPFDGVNAPATSNAHRQWFVPRSDIELIITTCPDHHWRTIVALARYGGLRCPSEVLSLRWQDVDWERSRIVVQSPKTEHHEGRATRTIPLFPELREHLEMSFALAPDGAVYVVDEKHRKKAMTSAGWANCNLRQRFERIIERAGVTTWPKLFQNLRASRETELAADHPIHVVTAWMGNTPKVAMDHYLIVTDDDFKRAAREDQAAQKAAHDPAQSGRAAGRGKPQVDPSAHEKTPVLPGFAGSCDFTRKSKMEDRGLEPLTS